MKYISSLLLIFMTLFFVFFYPLNEKSNRYDFIENTYISNDSVEYEKYNNFNNKLLDTYSIKIKLKKEKVKNKKLYLEIIDSTNKIFKTNQVYRIYNNSLIFELDKLTSNEIIIDYSNNKNNKISFSYIIYNNFEFNYLYVNKELIFGLCYGIMFCSFLYYGIMFYTTREKSFLYYSLMQIFAICTLAFFAYNNDYTSLNKQALIDIFENLTFLFTILFSQSVLYIKKNHKQINIIVNFIIYLHIVDLLLILIFKISILYLYVPLFIAFIIPIFLGLHVYLLGNKSALIYLIGWSLICISIFIHENNLIFIDTLYILHIVMPLESLVLSFALGVKLNQIIKDKNENEQLLIHSLRLSSTGEMINNISHQWKQPLSNIAFVSMDINLSNSENDLSSEYLEKRLLEIDRQVDFMSNTIDTFSDFYKTNKKKEFFSIQESIQQSLFILNSLIQDNHIQMDLSFIDDKKILGLQNEYSQVILNIISNSKDAFIKNNIKDAKIEIKVYKKNNKLITSITDNAGGIKENELDKIFDSYYTSKKQGSGIGLYMSRMIINKHFNGKIQVYNKDYGACFEIIM